MTQRAKRFSWTILLTTLGALAVASVLAVQGRSASARRDAPVREIVLDAKGIAFDGDNPTIEARPGERLRIVVRNTDPGVIHSIAVPALGVGRVDVGPGQTAVIDVVAGEPGTYEYVCPHHLPLMRGEIVIRP